MAHDILVVDDEDDIRLLIRGILEDEGNTTREAASSDQALAELDNRQPQAWSSWTSGCRAAVSTVCRSWRNCAGDVPNCRC